MAQIFQYSNLLSGTRSGEGWMRDGNGAGGGYSKVTGIELYNDWPSECFLHSPLVVLHKGTDYTLHCFAANTANMINTDWWVLDMGGGSSSYQWIGAHLTPKTPGPGGGVARCHVPSRCQLAGHRSVLRALRQQRLHGWAELPHMVPRHHAHRGHGAEGLGTGRGGGVAVDE